MGARYHDETEITSSKKEYTCIEDGDTCKLIIKQANTKLSGVYKCKAQNEIGFKESSATLSVYSKNNFHSIILIYLVEVASNILLSKFQN